MKLMSLLNDKSSSTTHANMAGANQHMTNDTKNMIDLVDKSDLNLIVGLLNGTLAKITHVGNLKLPSSVLNGKSPFSFVYGREPTLSHLRSFGCLCYATIVKGSDKETVFQYKMNKSSMSNVESETKVTNLNLFDFNDFETASKTPNSSPNDDEEETSVGEENQSKGNVGTNIDVPIFQNIFKNQTDKASQLRSTRSSKLPAKLNDYVLDNKFKYGLSRYANHFVLSAENCCFVSNLNKSSEASSYEEASKDVNWINFINDEMHALYENDAWELTNLPVGRKPIRSFLLEGFIFQVSDLKVSYSKFQKFRITDFGVSDLYTFSHLGFRIKSSKKDTRGSCPDPLSLVANSHAHSSNSHASSSYSHSPQPYYVTHPSFVIDNDDDYQGEIQGDAQEDKRTTGMMLLARAITQRYSTPTNNRLRSSSNSRNQAVIQDGRVDIQSKNVGYAGNGNQNAGRTNRNQGKTNVRCYNCNGKGHYARECPKLRVRDAKYFREQMLVTTKDEELNAAVIMMARIQPTDDKSNAKPTYDAEFISEVNASQVYMINGLLSKSDHEQCHHEKLETIIHTFVDDQIDSDIIFDDLYVDNNSGQAEHDTNVHDPSLHDFESLINNVQVEAKKQCKMNIELKKQKALLQQELETCQ
ncbi:integrase, catalytic region, zinc finger, CCHC-type containing protein [Tanacetum coccineum]|uniref:Integrase, catalytic region, zinc finger, CCHC-type containing protein n=1 Tax=Tanacetum coccineum TaxID=301880 RepID=A0ABQ5IXW0_9ASTR